MAFVAEVRTGSDPKYYRNAVVFATWAEADNYGADLAYRWTAVRDMRVAETDEEPNYVWIHGNLLPISKKEADPPEPGYWTGTGRAGNGGDI